MSDTQPQDYFVDLVSSMSFANGVFRITMGQQEAEGHLRSVVRLLIPANQLSTVLKGMADGASRLSERVREKEKGKEAVGANGSDDGQEEKAPEKKK